MKSFLFIILGCVVLFLCSNCTKEVEIPFQQDVLNFSMNCGNDSSHYYYTTEYDRNYLDISGHSVSIGFSDSVSEEYFNSLLEENIFLDSISYLNDVYSIATGYLKEDILCEEIEALLENLYLEINVLWANPNYYIMNSTSNCFPHTFDDCGLMRLPDEFAVSLNGESSRFVLDTLISYTNTHLIKETDSYILISADKYSTLNSLEASRLFYETGHFRTSSPNWIVRIIPG